MISAIIPKGVWDRSENAHKDQYFLSKIASKMVDNPPKSSPTAIVDMKTRQLGVRAIEMERELGVNFEQKWVE